MMKIGIDTLFGIIITVMMFIAAPGGGLFGQNTADFETEISNRTITITGYTGSAKNVMIPAEIGGLTVTTIGNAAFNGDELIGVDIPDSVTVIGLAAFAWNELSSVIIPDSVISIGDYAFAGNWLTSVTIPDSVTAIGEAVFWGNQLTSVTIPANVDIKVSSFFALLYANYIADNRKAAIYTFSRNSSGDFDIVISGNAVEITGYHGGKTELEIPSRINNLPVTAIEGNAFYDNQLTSVTIPDSVTTIGGRAFYDSPLTGVAIGANVDVSEDTFPGNLESVYTQGGRQAGTYISGDRSRMWRKQ